MKRKIMLGIASIAMVLTIAIGGTLAYFTDTDSAANVITMGKVDISLVEKTDATGEKEYTDGLTYSDVQPGQVLSKKPIVKMASNSQPAYIRVRINMSSVDAELSRHLSEIGLDTTGWIYVNGYYYYPYIVQPGANTTVFTKVSIPKDWGNMLVNKSFSIKITAEAVQASYFSPDFNSKTDPWHGVMIGKY